MNNNDTETEDKPQDQEQTNSPPQITTNDFTTKEETKPLLSPKDKPLNTPTNTNDTNSNIKDENQIETDTDKNDNNSIENDTKNHSKSKRKRHHRRHKYNSRSRSHSITRRRSRTRSRSRSRSNPYIPNRMDNNRMDNSESSYANALKGCSGRTYNIFVKNLPKTCSKQDLHNLFSRFGSIYSCAVIKRKKNPSTKCFGFVNFLSKNSQLSAMLSSGKIHMNNSIIECEESSNVTVVYMGNLPLEISSSDLRYHIRICGGPYKSLHIRHGHCFIVYDSYYCAEKSISKLQNTKIKGYNSKIWVAIASETKAKMLSNLSENASQRSLFIGNLSLKVTENELNNIFNKYGKITSIRIPKIHTSNKPRGFAFIEFENSGDAELAIRGENKKILYGQKIDIDWCRDNYNNTNSNNNNSKGYNNVNNSNRFNSGNNSHQNQIAFVKHLDSKTLQNLPMMEVEPGKWVKVIPASFMGNNYSQSGVGGNSMYNNNNNNMNRNRNSIGMRGRSNVRRYSNVRDRKERRRSGHERHGGHERHRHRNRRRDVSVSHSSRSRSRSSSGSRTRSRSRSRSRNKRHRRHSHRSNKRHRSSDNKRDREKDKNDNGNERERDRERDRHSRRKHRKSRSEGHRHDSYKSRSHSRSSHSRSHSIVSTDKSVGNTTTNNNNNRSNSCDNVKVINNTENNNENDGDDNNSNNNGKDKIIATTTTTIGNDMNSNNDVAENDNDIEMKKEENSTKEVN